MLLSVKLQVLTCNFSKRNTPPWVLFTFLNCTNGTKSCNASQIKFLNTFFNILLHLKYNLMLPISHNLLKHLKRHGKINFLKVHYDNRKFSEKFIRQKNYWADSNFDYSISVTASFNTFLVPITNRNYHDPSAIL